MKNFYFPNDSHLLSAYINSESPFIHSLHLSLYYSDSENHYCGCIHKIFHAEAIIPKLVYVNEPAVPKPGALSLTLSSENHRYVQNWPEHAISCCTADSVKI